MLQCAKKGHLREKCKPCTVSCTKRTRSVQGRGWNVQGPDKSSAQLRRADKRTRFAYEYLKDRNATQAAIRAGYSESCAAAQGSRLLKDARVMAIVGQKVEAVLTELEVDGERILKELAKIAFADLKGAFDEAGNLLPLAQIPDELRGAIGTIEATEGGEDGGRVRKVKTWEKVKALELLMRHKGMLKDQVELSGNVAPLVQVVNFAGASASVNGGESK